MALDLTMKITADASQAKAELRSVEQSIKKVEDAAQSSQSPIAKVAQALGGHSAQAESVVRSSAKLEQSSQRLAGQLSAEAEAWAAQAVAQTKARLGMDDTAKRIAALDQALVSSTQSVGAFGQGLVIAGAAIGAFVAVGLLELKFLYDSAKAYAEHSGMLGKYTDAVDTVKDAWHNMQLEVGRALLENVGDFSSWIGLIRIGLDGLSGYLTSFIRNFRNDLKTIQNDAILLASMMPGGRLVVAAAGALSGQLQSAGAAAIDHPFVADETYYSTTQGGYQSPFKFGSGSTNRILPGSLGPTRSQASALGLDVATRERMEAAAKKEAARAKAQRELIANTHVSYGLGLSSMGGLIPYDVSVPGTIPSLSYTEGIRGGLPGFEYDIGKPWENLPGANARTKSRGRYADPFTRDYFGFADKNGNVSGLGRGMNAAMGAYQLGMGAYQTWQATGQGGVGSRTLGGAMSGMQAGAMFGPWGAAVGAGAGALIGLARGLSAPKQGKIDLLAANEKIGALKSDFLAQFGGKSGVAALGGQDVLAAFGSQGNRGLEVLSKEIDKFKAKSVSSMNDLIHAAVTAGSAIPAALRPVLETMIRQGQLTAENARLLGVELPKTLPSFQEVTDAAEALGVSIEGIGDKVKGIRLAEQADTAARAFETLKDAGADMGAVFEGSVQKIQPMITEALRLGLAMPESIKPWLQQMVDAGLLVDETGAKLNDLSRFNFTEPLEKSIDRLIGKLDDLIDTLSHGVGGAIDDLNGSVVDVTVRRKYEDAHDNDQSNHPGVWTGGLVTSRGVIPFGYGAQYLARGGYVRPSGTDTVHAMLTPGEIVLNAAQQKRVAGAIANAPAGAPPIYDLTLRMEDGDVLLRQIVKAKRRNRL